MSQTISIRPVYLANTAFAFGTFMTLNGIYGTLRPQAVLTALNFSLPAKRTDQTLALGLARMFATTRLVYGITAMGMWYFGSWRALGVSQLASVTLALVDGFVTREIRGEGEWMHWWAAPIGSVLGLGLLLSEY